jgi:hypothetical protein
MMYAGGNVHSLASSGGKATYPPYGGSQSHPLRGWILYFLVLSFEFEQTPQLNTYQGGCGITQNS